MTEDTHWAWEIEPCKLPSPMPVAPEWNDWQPIESLSVEYDLDFCQLPLTALNPMESYLVEAMAYALGGEVKKVPTHKYCNGCIYDNLSQWKHDCQMRSECWIDQQCVAYVLGNVGTVNPHLIACYMRENLQFHPELKLEGFLDWIVISGGITVTKQLYPHVYTLMLKQCGHSNCVCL